MNISLPKLKAILLYFCKNTDPEFLGKVKMMKLIYFLDFMHLKKYGSPVTYDTYVNLEHGPIPSAIKNLVDSAVDDADNSVLSDVISFERPADFKMYRILPKRDFTQSDKKYFSESELEILKQVCLRFGNKNTKFIEDVAHKETPWQKTTFLQIIPYELAAEDKDSDVTKEEIELALSLA